jgi:hypothetical protein
MKHYIIIHAKIPYSFIFNSQNSMQNFYYYFDVMAFIHLWTNHCIFSSVFIHEHTHTHTSISKSASKYPTFHGCINLSEIWTLHQICGKHIQMCMQSITLHSRCGKTRTYKCACNQLHCIRSVEKHAHTNG